MKYDCSKTRDFMHEWVRYHKASGNDKFPIITSWEPASIEVLQKWSDEHPELPKLTKADKTLMDMCHCNDGRAWSIERSYYGLYVACVGTGKIPIEPHMFKMVGVGDKKIFDDLLKLEVEE